MEPKGEKNIKYEFYALTCCLNRILSSGDFFVKLDRNDSGKIKAALPTKTKPRRIELIASDFPGLQKIIK